jgi:hypothetical protein
MTVSDEKMAEVRRLDNAGVPRREITRRTGVSWRTINKALGPKDMRRLDDHRPVWSVYMPAETWRAARQIAKEHGYVIYTGNQAGREGSVGGMIEAIVSGELRVSRDG